GMAHIGIIKYLEEQGYEIVSISGCSMGALIGGFYAAGTLDTYTTWLKELNTLDMIKLLDFSGSGGLISGKKLFSTLETLLGDVSIETLPIKYTAVATDLRNEKEIWINSGSLLQAIRASISLPMFFTPVKYNDTLLIDVGVLNPVPIAPTFHDNSDISIAINLGGEINPSLERNTFETDSDFFNAFKKKLAKYTLPSVLSDDYSLYKVADKSFDTMQNTIARVKLSAYPPDIELTLPRNLCGTLEFNRADEIIDYGYAFAKTHFNT
ncbi:MAG TPA: serine protease, partial [Helicobacteraceae bacterium]|nr:serine protease [Helicobacteraceae bacterium]